MPRTRVSERWPEDPEQKKQEMQRSTERDQPERSESGVTRRSKMNTVRKRNQDSRKGDRERRTEREEAR